MTELDQEVRERLVKVESDVAHIRDAIDRLASRMEDNGRPGVLTRLDRLERAEAVRSRLLWIIATAVGGMLARTAWTMTFSAEHRPAPAAAAPAP